MSITLKDNQGNVFSQVMDSSSRDKGKKLGEVEEQKTRS
jgi:hypothetical protein